MIKIFNSDINFILSHPWWLWLAIMSGLILILFLGLRFSVWWQLQRQQKPVFSQRFYARPATESKALSLQTQILLSLCLGGGLGFFVWSWWGSLAGLVLGGLLPKAWQHQSQQQQQARLNQQLPLFLRALGSTLKAGYSVPQALQFVASEVQPPLRECLAPGVKGLVLQQPLESILGDWQRSIRQSEWKFLTDSLVVQSRTGGDLVDLCHKVAFLLEERLKLERDLKSFTAQGKMSGFLMAGLWPTSLLLFAWLAPSHTEVLFKTPAGQILLGLSLLLELVGFYAIWRIVRVKT